MATFLHVFSRGSAHARRRPAVLPLALVVAVAVCGSSAVAQVVDCPDGGSAAPHKAQIGAFITQLADFNVQQKTFSASFWLWTLKRPDERSALDSLEFPNAVNVTIDKPVSEHTAGDVCWVQRKVVGTFRHAWDMRRFPFDRQTLVIAIEETKLDLSRFEYVTDQANSSIDKEFTLTIPGWTVHGTTLEPVVKHYSSTFGDPRLPAGSGSAYTRANLSIDLERTDRSAFLKLTAAAFAAAALALFSFFLHVGHSASLSPRFSMLAGSVFAAVISLRSASGELGSVAYLTLIDEVHLAVLLYIFVAVVAAVFSWRYHETFKDGGTTKRIDWWVASISTAGLLSLIGMMVLAAKISS